MLNVTATTRATKLSFCHAATRLKTGTKRQVAINCQQLAHLYNSSSPVWTPIHTVIVSCMISTAVYHSEIEGKLLLASHLLERKSLRRTNQSITALWLPKSQSIVKLERAIKFNNISQLLELGCTAWAFIIQLKHNLVSTSNHTITHQIGLQIRS